MIYALTSTGAIVHLDYCCGKLSNISLAPVDQKKDECKKDILKGKSCCDSKQVHLSVKGEQEVTQKSVNLFSSPLSIQLISLFNFIIEPYENNYPGSNRPPPLYSSTLLFIQHSVFRI